MLKHVLNILDIIVYMSQLMVTAPQNLILKKQALKQYVAMVTN